MRDLASITRKTMAATASPVDDTSVRVICSTEDMDRGGEVIVQAGIDLTAYRRNPVVLFQHDPGQPVARAEEIKLEDGRLVAVVRFPPPGVSPRADECRGLVKAGVISGVSVGINPIHTEPMDPMHVGSSAPLRYLRSELMEFSFVAVPANPAAVVVARSASGPATKARDAGRAWVRAQEARIGTTASAPPAQPADRVIRTKADALAWIAEAETSGAQKPKRQRFNTVADLVFARATGRLREGDR